MNARERFLEVCNFNPNIPALKWEFGYWGETIKNWYAQGLPRRRYPPLPAEITTPASSLYIPAWTCRGDGVLPNGIAVIGGVLSIGPRKGSRWIPTSATISAWTSNTDWWT